MSTLPKRQRILEALFLRLSDIQVENGYRTNAGQRVYLGETPDFGVDDPVNAIVIVVQDTQPTYQAMNVVETLPIEIQAMARVESIDQSYLAAESILGDIVQAVEQEDRTIGGLVSRQIVLGTTRTIPREPGSTTVGVGITYVAQYVRPWGSA